MKKISAVKTSVDSRRTGHLLDRIREMRVEVADELNEEELTRLLLRAELPAEAGFAFLSFRDQFVTLSVPQQDLAKWYPEKGWILPAKVKIARAIADKYGLSLCEPPDMAYPPFDKPNPHHHLELCSRRETIILAHPRFLKVRLFAASALTFSTVPLYRPFPLGPDLLQDLSALYQV
jgi:hypothetical protein